jgi:DNA-binding transcriptional ArsR family regulator
MNDSLYNPDTMSKEEIKALFVARQPLLDELVSTIRSQPTGAGVQHLLIIAPRGMGKTTMLLMVQFAVEDNKELAKNWQAVRFPEESYDITELADFWLKVLDYLDDESLKPKIEEIEQKFRNGEDLREAAWALVKDWSKKHKKRIVLLADNFNEILKQINNDVEQARLRDILMNDGTVMLIGCAPTYFYEIQNYEQPLYNFFKLFNLNDLKFPDIEELLRRRAELDEFSDIEGLLQKNRSHIKSLEAFTGGNPRLVLMLYRIISNSDMIEVTKGFGKLLDNITPYYNLKTEKLPAQQRKIVNEIALYSLEKNEGISPTEIAQRVRMTPNQVSSQLKRLAENGFVKSLNIRGRSSLYAISEPLYAIWAQMRFGRNAHEKRNWLVQILKALYDVQEIQKEIEKLDERVKGLKLDGRKNKARGVLEYMVCLIETHPSLMQKNFSLAIDGYLELKELSSIKIELETEKWKDLPVETWDKLFLQGAIDKERLKAAKSYKYIIESKDIFLNILENDDKSDENLEKYGKIIKLLENVKEMNIDALGNRISIVLASAYKDQADILWEEKKYEDVDLLLNRVIEIFDETPKNDEREFFLEKLADTHIKKAIIFSNLNQKGSVLTHCNEVIEIYEDLLEVKKIEEVSFTTLAFAYFLKILALLSLGKFEYAEKDLTTLMEQFKLIKKNKPIELITSLLTVIYDVKFSQRIKDVLRKHQLEETFIHLITAINYLETKDESLLEKLSPEVRIVVEETIKTLQMMSDEQKAE